jgi:hypothetical protein
MPRHRTNFFVVVVGGEGGGGWRGFVRIVLVSGVILYPSLASTRTSGSGSGSGLRVKG